ncbi:MULTISPECIES: LysR family transcriptional regulator [Alphaproteobacteria]|uniref:Transcriptional regulator n=2 Tax=Alphaproteobacteria TaxID=28211 RepID=A0A512HH19_9HYPH|nr:MULTISPECIES: LysR family transcriptional regulator [Alphaproteobacteria]GEO84738.1 transcriptional regulator [Ciceribacter naphthalenivorans]GLR20641.1 transcriptional regulator [Ciceribacter naphthalenivorans]GLT03497.1 transcriptional regulator [Sphingomonas psychrolutea]
MDRFVELEIFTRIAEEANLTRAAEELGLSVSGVSRCLAGLENRLGVRLVQRSTRQLSLTSEGERFARSARDILFNLNEAEASVSLVAAEPRGTLRIGSSLSFALLHLMPVIREFKARYPMVGIDLQASNRYCDIIENGLDVAIRTRLSEVDSSVTIRKLAEVPRLLVASPDYIEKNGTPAEPEDLERHALLLYTLSDDWDHLTFTRNDVRKRLPMKPEIASNDGQLLRRAALDGMGILVQPAYVVHNDLAAGRLVPVLENWTLPRLTMNVVFPSRTHLPARTRLFIDALVMHFRENDLERNWTGQPDRTVQ